ncbi:hypothetical protein V2G26_003227 [Clonostachys chloroleuca]
MADAPLIDCGWINNELWLVFRFACGVLVQRLVDGTEWNVHGISEQALAVRQQLPIACPVALGAVGRRNTPAERCYPAKALY